MTGNHHQFLDTIQRHLESGEDVAQTMDSLFDHLFRQREKLTKQGWKDLVHLARQHPLKDLVHQDPFTLYSFLKPRGYSGDAVLLDYIYEENEIVDCSPLGYDILRWNISVPEAQAVRNRRDLIADLIDLTAVEVRSPHILSVAAGHLREAKKSKAILDRHFGRFVVLDKDPQTLARVERELPGHSFKFTRGLVQRLLSREKALDQFDLIYAAGLYDYLSHRTAIRLTEVLFHKLKPNGCLLLTNFLKGSTSAGYMETYMDWYLIYRDLDQITALLKNIPTSEINEIRLSRDDTTTLGYLMVRRN